MSTDAGLDPATAARRIAESFLESGQAPEPPPRLDREYSSGGGVFVDLRERESDELVGSGGFWRFDPSAADPCRDLVNATIQAVSQSDWELSPALLPELKLAVSFIDTLQPTTLQQLDLATRGVVVSSPDRRRLGFAPPNAEHIADEVEQYEHARAMARIPAPAPHELLSYTVTRCIEPGTTWPPFEVAREPRSDWSRRPEIGEHLSARAQAVLRAIAGGTSVEGSAIPNDLVPAPVFGIGVHLFHRGRSVNGVSWGASLDECLEQAVRGALDEAPGLQLGSRELAAEAEAVMVSMLHDRQWLGEFPPEQAAARMRAGHDAIAVVAEDRNALSLPMTMISESLTKRQLVQNLLAEAGITSQPCSWALFPTTSWLGRGNQVYRICHGFPERSGTISDVPRWQEDVELLGRYLFSHLADGGLPEYRSEPTVGRARAHGELSDAIHALIALDRAGESLGNGHWRQAAVDGFRHCLGHAAGDLADCFLVAGICRAGGTAAHEEQVAALADRLRSLVGQDGRIASVEHTTQSLGSSEHLPGAVLLALAAFAEATGDCSLLEQLQPCLRWYRGLFRLTRQWAMLCWQLRGWAAVTRLTHDPEQTALVWELADWAVERQHARSGAFLSAEAEGGFGALTGRVLAAMAAAWDLAASAGDRERADRYRRSCCDGLRFMSRLIIIPEDTFCMPDPEAAVGGVRDSLDSCVVRVDNLSHTLLALATCLGVRTHNGERTR